MLKSKLKTRYQIPFTRYLLGGIAILLCTLTFYCRPKTFDIPEPSFHTLKNDMKVFVVEDASLPTFRLYFYHPPGAIFERETERGVASITAEILRTGGTQKKTPEQVNATISDASAAIELGASRDSASGSLRVLKEDRYAMLGLLSEILRTPRFDPDAFEVARRQAQVGLRRSKEKPSGIASLYFSGLIYGPDSPWAVVPTETDLANLTVAKAQDFYKRNYYPDRMILAVSGDFKTQEIIGELEATLGQWNKKSPDKLKWPGFEVETPQTVFVSKNAAQVALRLGHLGKKRTNPDKFPLLVANFILGGSGSMTSRLGAEIRSSKGQAYSVWSHYSFNRIPGIFVMVAQTEASQQQEVMQSMRRILKELREKGVNAKDVDEAKKAILRSLLFDFESRFSIVKNWARFEFWGYPRNYLKFFAKQIEKVDVAAVNRVLREDFHPEKLTTMVVGPENLWLELKQSSPDAKRMEVQQ